MHEDIMSSCHPGQALAVCQGAWAAPASDRPDGAQQQAAQSTQRQGVSCHAKEALPADYFHGKISSLQQDAMLSTGCAPDMDGITPAVRHTSLSTPVFSPATCVVSSAAAAVSWAAPSPLNSDLAALGVPQPSSTTPASSPSAPRPRAAARRGVTGASGPPGRRPTAPGPLPAAVGGGWFSLGPCGSAGCSAASAVDASHGW